MFKKKSISFPPLLIYSVIEIIPRFRNVWLFTSPDELSELSD